MGLVPQIDSSKGRWGLSKFNFFFFFSAGFQGEEQRSDEARYCGCAQDKSHGPCESSHWSASICPSLLEKGPHDAQSCGCIQVSQLAVVHTDTMEESSIRSRVVVL